uniref:Putative secreted protein n=1 Tax=Anopheles darlingi TaxID=43151 RepID=A0A2M4DHF9_ANODA
MPRVGWSLVSMPVPGVMGASTCLLSSWSKQSIRSCVASIGKGIVRTPAAIRRPYALRSLQSPARWPPLVPPRNR